MNKLKYPLLLLCFIFFGMKSQAQCDFYKLTNTSTTSSRTYFYYICNSTVQSQRTVSPSSTVYLCAKSVITSTGTTQILVSSFTSSPTCITSGNSVTLNATTNTTNNGIFSITSPSGLVTSGSTLTIPNFTSSNTGTYTVTLGGCSSATSTLALSFGSNGSLTASSNGPVCEGNTLSLTSSIVNESSPITYRWSGPNGFTSTLANPIVSANATSAMGGTYTVIATTSRGCVLTASTNVQINKAVASSNGPVCQGTTLSLSASSITGATYFWNGPNGFTSTQQNPVISTSATDVLAGVYNVYTTANGCTSPLPSSVTVAVKPIPSSPSASSNAPVCVGAPLNLSASTITGVTYSWTGPNGFTSTQQNPSVGTSATTLMAGFYSVKAILNGCISPVTPTNVVINKITASNNGPVCQGKTLSLSATSVTGAVYNWTGPNGFTSTQQNPIVSANATSQMLGAYSVTSTANGCTSVVSTTIATVNAAPTAPTVTTPVSYCQNQAASVLSASGTNLLWYTTSTSTTGVVTAPTPSTSVAGTQSYYVSQTLNTCESPKSVINVIINPVISAAGPISGFNNVCTGQSSVTYSVAPITNATNYVWTLPFGATGSSSTNTIVVSYGATAVSGNNITVKGINSCGSGATSSLLINIGTQPAAFITMIGTSPICQGSSLQLIANTGTGLSYQWKKDGVDIIGATGNTYLATATGTYSAVVGYNSSCSQTSNSISIVVNAAPNLIVTPSAQSICSGTSVTISATGTGASTYSWSPSTGLNSVSSATVNANPTTTTTYQVIGTSSLGCKDTAITTITVLGGVSSTPVFTQISPKCSGNSFTFPTTSNNGITGTWLPPVNNLATTLYTFTPTAGQCATTTTTMTVVIKQPTSSTSLVSICSNTLPYVWNGVSYTTSGLYTKVFSGGNSVGCDSTANLNLTVKPTPVITVSATNPTGCSTANGSILISGLAQSSSYTLNYSFNSVAVAPTAVISSSNGVINISNLSSGVYSNIVVTLNGCTSNTAGPLTLTGSSAVPTPTITGNSTLCQGQTLNLTASVSSTSAVTYSWTGPNGISQVGSTSSITIANTITAFAGLYSVTATINSCTSSAATRTVLIKQPTSSTTTASICQGQSYIFNGVTYTSAGTYSQLLINTAGCDSTATLILSTNGSGNIVLSPISGNRNINKCDTLQTYSVNTIAGAPYNWTVTGVGNYIRTGQNTNVVTAVMKVAGTISVSATNSCSVAGVTSSLSVIKSTPTTPGTIYQKIFPVTVAANSNVCLYTQSAFATTNQADTFMIKSVANAKGYMWKVPAGSVLTNVNDTTIAVVFSNSIVLPDTIKVYAYSACDTSLAKSLPLTKTLATTPGVMYQSFNANSTTGPAAVTSVCNLVGGGSETYIIRKIATATSYNWSLSIGTNAVITHLNPLGVNDTAIRVTYNTGFTKDTIKVNSINGCGASTNRTLAVSAILLPPTVTAISGSLTPCIGNVIAYSASATVPTAAQSAISVYRWTKPNFTTIISAAADSSSITLQYNTGFVGGSISAKGQSACGIAGTAKSITLLYLPPTPTSITSSTGIYNACIGNSITYTVVAPAPSITQLPAVKYRWTKPNFTTITSASTDSLSITVSFNAGYIGGSLTVKGQTACGALGTAKTQALTHTACAVGTKISDFAISESLQKLDLKILPNPTTTEFNIQLISPFKELASIKVMDLQGRLIQKSKTKSFEKINVGNNFKPGVYLIEVKQGSQKMTYRAVKF